ncbi:MAG: DUF3016 domain-containing protein [Rhodospirillaceae bacterium]
MRKFGLALAALFATGTAHAADVTFTDPKKFMDATFDRPRTERNLREVQDAVAKMFSQLADKYLAPGQTLKVEVRDIDLAGRIVPTAANDIRVMSSSSWPRLAFAYTVTENGAVVHKGEADIHDFNYLTGFNRSFIGDRLRYERQMLADWFRKNLAAEDA